MAALIVFAACSKEELPKPQIITYEAWCDNCFIFLEDAAVNRTNVEELKDYKKFNVSGYFRYEFENTKNLEKVFATIIVSVFYPYDQDITVRITDSRSGNVREESHRVTTSDRDRISIEMEL